jgi:hypothetical protein
MFRAGPHVHRRIRRGVITEGGTPDFFTAHGAIIALNSRLGVWTVRRNGKIIGQGITADAARSIARETAKPET